MESSAPANKGEATFLLVVSFLFDLEHEIIMKQYSKRLNWAESETDKIYAKIYN